ncbi:MAG: hypothetical protein K1X89_06110 [Myxococcaceae bacterium]|nr:hypothetical protein [Myxococcaceae bacterium]
MRALAVAAVVLAACGPQLKPETLVDQLRVLSLTAEPPEIHPGDTTQVEVLELDPSRPMQVTTVVWVGCDPDPFNLGRGACNDTTALLQPTAFSTFPPGVRILGFGPKAFYTPPADLFSVLEKDDPIRFNGTVGQILAVVIGEEVKPTSSDAELRELFTRIEKQEVQTVLALTRVTVSEKAALNKNPRLETLVVDGQPLPKGAQLLAAPGQHLTLTLSAPAEDRETYEVRLPDGPQQRTESLVAAWYSSAGRFRDARIDLDTHPDTTFIAPGGLEVPDDPLPPRRQATLWSVLRDSRGGQAWKQYPLFVCDASLARPSVSMVVLPSSRDQAISVKGTNLGSTADVVIGGVALGRSVYRAATDEFVGDWPDLPPGTYPVRLRGKDCSDADTGLSVTLP